MKFKILFFLSLLIMSLTGCDSKETISSDTFTEKKEVAKPQPQVDEVKKENNEQKKDENTFVFDLKTYDNKTINLKISNGKWSFSGTKGKIVLLNFFGTWCPPCKAEIPHLNKIRTQLKDKFEIIALDIGNRDGSMNTAEQLEAFAMEYDVKYPMTRGRVNNEIFNGLGNLNPSGSIPFMVLFDQDGNFAKPYIGMVSEQQLVSDIQTLLKK